MLFVIREPKVTKAVASEHAPASLGHVLKSRNILVAMAALCCAMTGVFVLGALLPLYLTDYWRSARRRWASSCRRSVSAVSRAIRVAGAVQPGRPPPREHRRLRGNGRDALYLPRPRPAAARPVRRAVRCVVLHARAGVAAGPARWRPRPRPSAVSTSIGVVVGSARSSAAASRAAMGGFVAALWHPEHSVAADVRGHAGHRGQPAAEAAPAVLQRRMAAVQPGTGSGRAIAVRPWAGWAVRAGRRHRRLTSIG